MALAVHRRSDMIASPRWAIALVAPCALACSAPAAPERDNRQSNLTVTSPTMPALPPALPPAVPRVVPPGHREALRTTIRQLDARLGLAPYLGLDNAELEARALSLLETGGTSADDGFWLGMRAIVGAYPVGHLSAAPSDPSVCGTPQLPRPASSALGACTQPYADHAVVTVIGSENPLGLGPGDEIVAVNDVAGQAMLDGAFGHAMCGATGSASASNRRAIAATTLLATVAVGSTITVKHPGGAVERKSVTTLAQPMTCSDPFGRGGAYAAQATLRPDGAAVIHVPSFYASDYTEADAYGSVARFEAAIAAEFSKVRTAPIVVIDLRGNGGGFSYVALKMAGGLPGATATTVGACARRTPGSQSYVPEEPLAVVPSPEYGLYGKVAILSDGLSISASDYFLRAAKAGGRALIVGRPSAGAYGSGSDPFDVSGGPPVTVYSDPNRCVDGAGRLLEGQSVTPHLEVDLDPQRLAQGIDSDLEAAVAWLRSH